MKNTLLSLLVVFSFMGCTTDIIDEKNIETESSFATQKTTAPIIGQILQITYEKEVTRERMQEIRSYYFQECYTGQIWSGIPSTYFYSVEMYDPYPSNSHLEFWIIISCNNGRPGGIGGGMPGEMIID